MTPERVLAVTSGKVDPWENPVFADFVIVRDYLEERGFKTGFRVVYPQTETLPQFLPCFEALGYEDIVFNSWMTMPEKKRKDLAKRKGFWVKYDQAMNQIGKELFDDEF
jgi:hypothetical protein